MQEILAYASAARQSLHLPVKRSRYSAFYPHYTPVCSRCDNRRYATNSTTSQTPTPEYEADTHPESPKDTSGKWSLSTEKRRFLDSAVRERKQCMTNRTNRGTASSQPGWRASCCLDIRRTKSRPRPSTSRFEIPHATYV